MVMQNWVQLNEDEIGVQIHAEDGCFVGYASWFPNVDKIPDYDLAHKNAAVMAAAPKLLRALKQIIEVCPECDGCGIADHAGMVPCPWCETARAAVANAEGGAA